MARGFHSVHGRKLYYSKILFHDSRTFTKQGVLKSYLSDQGDRTPQRDMTSTKQRDFDTILVPFFTLPL